MLAGPITKVLAGLCKKWQHRYVLSKHDYHTQIHTDTHTHTHTHHARTQIHNTHARTHTQQSDETIP